MPPRDTILVSGLEVAARVGALPGEKDRPQRLSVSLEIEPSGGFAGLGDRLEWALDYAAVAGRVKELSAGIAPDLIETFAEAVAAMILREFPADRVGVEVRKFVPLGADHVAVRLVREKGR
jgi:dihydroneopterin aldolase